MKLNEVDLGDFTDRDLDVPAMTGPRHPLPYYLAHAHRLINAVAEEGDQRGFIEIAVWRPQATNRPYNARIMENILSLAYFYCTDTPWNPYHGDAALRARLEAALTFWTGMANAEGQFSEYGRDQWNLAPTAFATKFMGETLRLLAQGPPIDPEIHRAAIETNRNAFRASFEDGWSLGQGQRFTNQWGNYWPGAMAHIDLFGDAELAAQLLKWVEATSLDGEHAFQSVTGYFTEQSGPDWGYNFGTHMSNTLMAWHYAAGHGDNAMRRENRELMTWLLEEQTLFAEWLGYNALLEPDGSEFVLNRGISTRQRLGSFTYRDFPMADAVEGLRPFLPTQEIVAQRRAEIRRELAAAWPEVEALRTGTTWAFSPYAFLHRTHEVWYPDTAQRQQARARLPYLASNRFIHQRVDDRYVFTYIRRPAYYAAFNAGRTGSDRQRMGLGLLWHPQAGTLMQSQNGRSLEAWGTRAGAANQVYEAGNLQPDFTLDGESLKPETGAGDLPDVRENLTIRYSLGGGKGVKQIVFTDEAIRVSVQHDGAFLEQFPLLVREDAKLTLDGGSVRLLRGAGAMVIEFEGAETLVQTRGDGLEVVTAGANGKLNYTIRWESE
ncbi:MAG: hypothetical protein JJU05_10200 [Verrucomicrobia bacterium]|nr:hypothetical protein [Verrucomicrobiota bacterium]MCH8525864.1 hypothetical protein [Kiritimatiellia bacterium]